MKYELNLPCAKPMIIINHYDLGEKRISFWVRMRGGTFSNGKLSNAFKAMREITGYKYCNQNLCMEYYGVLFTVGIYLAGGNVDVNIQCKLNNKSVAKFSRPYKNGQKFTHEELRLIDNGVRDEAHRIFTENKTEGSEG